MFIGQYYHTLEEKGRLSLPKDFRSQTQKWIVTRGLDGGLFGFKKEDFLSKLTTWPGDLTKKVNRDFLRLMTNQAVELTPDRLGRINLPEFLIDLAQLKKAVVILGSGDLIEIWDREIYFKYLDDLNQRAESIAESVTHAHTSFTN